jgi:hypothetical protein
MVFERRHTGGVMSEIAETPSLASPYCPGCEPNRDPLREILAVQWCVRHQPSFGGPDDARATLSRAVLSSLGEAEAESNRGWCDLVHRRHPRP